MQPQTIKLSGRVKLGLSMQSSTHMLLVRITNIQAEMKGISLAFEGQLQAIDTVLS